jgi:hypothetical protein
MMDSIIELIPWYAWFIPVLIPFVIEHLTSSTMATWKKSVTAFVVCTLIALGAVALAGKFDWKNIVATVGIVFTEAQILYDNFFKAGIKARQATRESLI